MKKDNFDLRSYLIENKMTENSRGDVRHQLGKTVLDTRILAEMQIPADPDQLEEGDPYDHHDPEYDEDWAAHQGADMADTYNDAQMDAGIEECGVLGGDIPLDEAGYTDDDDDDEYAPDDLDLDDEGGASLLDLVKGDRKAGRARKAAAADTAADDAMADDEPVADDAPEIDDPDAENAAGASDPNAEAQPGLSAQVKYNPNTVEMMMDDQELDQYLSGFRRPQVAVNVLNRAIRTAQDEVNDSIGLNHLYIVLENGFYVTSRTERGQVIAKVSADQEWRKKNFGDDNLEEGIFGNDVKDLKDNSRIMKLLQNHGYKRILTRDGYIYLVDDNFEKTKTPIKAPEQKWSGPFKTGTPGYTAKQQEEVFNQLKAYFQKDDEPADAGEKEIPHDVQIMQDARAKKIRAFWDELEKEGKLSPARWSNYEKNKWKEISGDDSESGHFWWDQHYLNTADLISFVNAKRLGKL